MSALLLLDPVPLPDGLSIPAEAWRETPISVRHQVLSLLKQVEAREARLHRDSSNASRPPSTASLSKKRQRRVQAAERRQPGATPGHPGHHQGLLEPTASVALWPDTCVCGHRRLADVTLLVHDIDETSWLLHGDRQWLWVMANPAVASFQIPSNRSKGCM